MGGLVESQWLNYNKKDQFKLKSVFTGGGACMCVWGGGGFKTCRHGRGEGKGEYFPGHYKMPLRGVSKAV